MAYTPGWLILNAKFTVASRRGENIDSGQGEEVKENYRARRLKFHSLLVCKFFIGRDRDEKGYIINYQRVSTEEN